MIKNTKKNNKSKWHTLIFILIVFLGVVVVLITAFSINSQYQNRLDKADQEMFHAIEDQLELLTNELNTTESWEGGTSCSRASVKYSTSDEAWCIVNYSSYESLDQRDVSEVIDEYNSLIEQSSYVGEFNNDTVQHEENVSISFFNLSRADSNIKCYAQYEDMGERLRIALDCSGPARDTWFSDVATERNE